MNGDRHEPGILGLAVALFLAPVRTFLHGMERMVETLKEVEQATDRGADSFFGGPARGGFRPLASPWPASLGPAGDPPAVAGSEPAIIDREPRTAGGARDGAGDQPSKEDKSMYQDQDLSGNMVKVVQYCIVSVVTSIDDNARVIVQPRIKAFADDMTAEDFTSWVIAEDHHLIDEYKEYYDKEHGEEHDHHHHHHVGPRPWDRKYLRVAFTVMGRFSPAEIDWTELQAMAVARIAASFPPVFGKLPAAEPKSGKSAKGGT
jgi:hypothetical protein